MTKRKQVKQACVNCQRACKKCDDIRPCQRCCKLGLSPSCIDVLRKRDLKPRVINDIFIDLSQSLMAVKVDSANNLPAPIPIVKSANLDALAIVCSDEYSRCSEEIADDSTDHERNLRIHMHRMLSNFNPFPVNTPPTPPPSPFPFPNSADQK